MMIISPYVLNKSGGDNGDSLWEKVVLLTHIDEKPPVDAKGNSITSNSARVIAAAARFGNYGYNPSISDSIKLISDSFRFLVKDYTVEFFFQIDSLPSSSQGEYSVFCTMSDIANQSPTSNFLSINYQGFFVYYCPESSIVCSGKKIITGVYYHVAICRDSSGVRIYLDGELAGQFIGSPVSSNNPALLFGSYFNSGIYPSPYFDEVRVTVGACRYSQSFIPPNSKFPG